MAPQKDKARLLIQELSVLPEPRLTENSYQVPESFVKSIQYLSDALIESPAPVVNHGIAGVVLSDKLCFWNLSEKGALCTVFDFDSRIVSFSFDDDFYYVMTDRGSLFKGKY